jgi:hypothetical protein
MTPPTRPQPPLVDDGYYVEPEPLDDRVPAHPRYRLVRNSPRRGCSPALFLVLAAGVGWIVVILFIAAVAAALGVRW